MKMPKPSDVEKERFAALVPTDDPRVELKPMFGNLGAFVNGNMFMGLFGSAVGIKLPADQLAELEKVEGTAPFGPEERPMGGYLSLPPGWVETAAEDAHQWVQRAVTYVGGLPPKAPKKT